MGAIANQCGSGVAAEDISLQLSAGSVIVNATIKSRYLEKAETIFSVLSAPSEITHLVDLVTQRISSMDGVESVSNGPILVLKGEVSLQKASALVLSKEDARTQTLSTTSRYHEVYEDISSAPVM